MSTSALIQGLCCLAYGTVLSHLRTFMGQTRDDKATLQILNHTGSAIVHYLLMPGQNHAIRNTLRNNTTRVLKQSAVFDAISLVCGVRTERPYCLKNVLECGIPQIITLLIIPQDIGGKNSCKACFSKRRGFSI